MPDNWLGEHQSWGMGRDLKTDLIPESPRGQVDGRVTENYDYQQTHHAYDE